MADIPTDIWLHLWNNWAWFKLCLAIAQIVNRYIDFLSRGSIPKIGCPNFGKWRAFTKVAQGGPICFFWCCETARGRYCPWLVVNCFQQGYSSVLLISITYENSSQSNFGNDSICGMSDSRWLLRCDSLCGYEDVRIRFKCQGMYCVDNVELGLCYVSSYNSLPPAPIPSDSLPSTHYVIVEKI